MTYGGSANGRSAPAQPRCTGVQEHDADRFRAAALSFPDHAECRSLPVQIVQESPPRVGADDR